jgi:hypothetical protein
VTSSSTRLGAADRAGLALLCLLLVLSVSVRLHTYWGARLGTAPAAEAQQVDLGDDVFMPPEGAVHRVIRTDGCGSPVAVDFVDPSPHGNDVSLATPQNTGDRVYYVYHGWTLGGRLAAMRLSMLYFMRQAAAVAQFNGLEGRHERAVRLVVPAECGAPPGEVMDVLRRVVRARD